MGNFWPLVKNNLNVFPPHCNLLPVSNQMSVCSYFSAYYNPQKQEYLYPEGAKLYFVLFRTAANNYFLC